MPGFSISCTTCRSRLKVRDLRILGQILPCPKCGSMVLIERPEAPVEDAGPGRSSPGAPAPTTRMPRSDSFEQIDQLLDQPLRLPVGGGLGDDRWRVPRAEADAPSGPSVSSAEVEGAADPNVPTSDVAEAADWLASRTAGRKTFLLMGGGVLAGFALAAGLTGWLLSRPAEPNVVAEGRSEPARAQAVASDDGEQIEEETAASADSSQLAAANSAATTSPSDADDGDDPLPTPVPSPNLVADTADDSAESPPPPDGNDPTSVDVDVQVPPPAPSPASNPLPQTPVAGEPSPRHAAQDDLAAFAQWLQDPDAAQVPMGPPMPDPASVEPVTDRPASGSVTVIQPTRPVPPLVDVAARLEEPISALQLKHVTLLDALRLVTQLSTIPIRLDPLALGRRNLQPDHPIDLLVRDQSVRGLLDEILSGTGLAWRAVDGHVLVTTAADAKGELVTLPHEVSDLANNDPAMTAHLAAYVQQLIQFGSWRGQGDDAANDSLAHCDVDGTSLLVTHEDTVQYEVLVFCEKLRVARGLDPRTRIMRDRIALGPRVSLCTRLDKPIGLRLWRDHSIDEIAAALERQADVQILVDWPALHEAGWTPQDTEKFFHEQQTLREVLDEWLPPKGLTFRVIDPTTLEITTTTALAVRHDVEFYPLTRDGDRLDVHDVTRQLVAQLGADIFQPTGYGAVAYDELSGTLVVSLPQPEQGIVAKTIEQAWQRLAAKDVRE